MFQKRFTPFQQVIFSPLFIGSVRITPYYWISQNYPFLLDQSEFTLFIGSSRFPLFNGSVTALLTDPSKRGNFALYNFQNCRTMRDALVSQGQKVLLIVEGNKVPSNIRNEKSLRFLFNLRQKCPLGRDFAPLGFYFSPLKLGSKANPWGHFSLRWKKNLQDFSFSMMENDIWKKKIF